MYHDIVNHVFQYGQNRYKIEDMIKAILRRYPNMYNSSSFQATQDLTIDYTMSMDSNEQTDEMIRIMVKAVNEDKKAKLSNDSVAREIAARNFLVAVNLHRYYRIMLNNILKKG